MNCSLHTECEAVRSCYILNQCVYEHELIKNPKDFQVRLRKIKPESRVAFILKHFEKIKPPKVSWRQMKHDRANQVYIKHGMEPIPYEPKKKKLPVIKKETPKEFWARQPKSDQPPINKQPMKEYSYPKFTGEKVEFTVRYAAEPQMNFHEE